jgi:hypothetical protein
LHQWQEGGNTYLRICISAYLGNNKITKKIEKNQERIIRYRLKKNVPAGSNAYLCICHFLKKSQPEAYKNSPTKFWFCVSHKQKLRPKLTCPNQAINIQKIAYWYKTYT